MYKKSPLYLSCSQLLVEDYLEQTNEDFQEVVLDYVGPFANETDLEQCCHNPYVYYGNHTYTHSVSCLMTDDKFMDDVENNSKFLQRYPNYVDYFAFPFGQPELTFTGSQVQLLLETGFK